MTTPTYKVGDRVTATNPEWEGNWFPGTITTVNRNDTYRIDFDDGDMVPETHPSNIRLDQVPDPSISKTLLTKGNRVRAKVGTWKAFYPGTIAAINLNGTAQVNFDDGEVVDSVTEIQMRPEIPELAPGLCKNSRVEVYLDIWDQPYQGVIQSIDKPNSTMHVIFDDGEDIPDVPFDCACPVSNPAENVSISSGKSPRTSKVEYSVGQRVEAKIPEWQEYYKGTVKSVNPGLHCLHILFDDGDDLNGIQFKFVRSCNSSSDPQNLSSENKAMTSQLPILPIGTRVEVQLPSWTEHYSGQIEHINSNGTYKVVFDDGETVLEVSRALIRVLPSPPPEARETSITSDNMRASSGCNATDQTHKFTCGSRVEAKVEGWNSFFPGTIALQNPDCTFRVNFDDGDIVESVHTSQMRSISGAAPAKLSISEAVVGAKVEAIWTGWDQFYPGTIKEVNADGTFAVAFNDGDFVPNVQLEQMRAVQSIRDEHVISHEVDHNFNVKDKVEAKVTGWTEYFPGVITLENNDGTYAVAFDDGDMVPNVKPSEMRIPNSVTTTSSNHDPVNPLDIVVGGKVEAMVPSWDQYYPGRVFKKHSDGTYHIMFEDGDEVANVKLEEIRLLQTASTRMLPKFRKGDRVEAKAPGWKSFYPGTVGVVNLNGTTQVVFDDGDVVDSIDQDQIRALVPVLVEGNNKSVVNYRVQDRVEVMVDGWDTYYPGTIVCINPDNTFAVDFDDGDKVPCVKLSEMKRIVDANTVDQTTNGCTSQQPDKDTNNSSQNLNIEENDKVKLENQPRTAKSTATALECDETDQHNEQSKVNAITEHAVAQEAMQQTMVTKEECTTVGDQALPSSLNVVEAIQNTIKREEAQEVNATNAKQTSIPKIAVELATNEETESDSEYSEESSNPPKSSSQTSLSMERRTSSVVQAEEQTVSLVGPLLYRYYHNVIKERSGNTTGLPGIVKRSFASLIARNEICTPRLFFGCLESLGCTKLNIVIQELVSPPKMAKLYDANTKERSKVWIGFAKCLARDMLGITLGESTCNIDENMLVKNISFFLHSPDRSDVWLLFDQLERDLKVISRKFIQEDIDGSHALGIDTVAQMISRTANTIKVSCPSQLVFCVAKLLNFKSSEQGKILHDDLVPFIKPTIRCTIRTPIGSHSILQSTIAPLKRFRDKVFRKLRQAAARSERVGIARGVLTSSQNGLAIHDGQVLLCAPKYPLTIPMIQILQDCQQIELVLPDGSRFPPMRCKDDRHNTGDESVPQQVNHSVTKNQRSKRRSIIDEALNTTCPKKTQQLCRKDKITLERFQLAFQLMDRNDNGELSLDEVKHGMNTPSVRKAFSGCGKDLRDILNSGDSLYARFRETCKKLKCSNVTVEVLVATMLPNVWATLSPQISRKSSSLRSSRSTSRIRTNLLKPRRSLSKEAKARVLTHNGPPKDMTIKDMQRKQTSNRGARTKASKMAKAKFGNMGQHPKETQQWVNSRSSKQWLGHQRDQSSTEGKDLKLDAITRAIELAGLPPRPEDWNNKQVLQWLKHVIELPQYCVVFENMIEGEDLWKFDTHDALMDLGVDGYPLSFLHRRKLIVHIQHLTALWRTSPDIEELPLPTCRPGTSPDLVPKERPLSSKRPSSADALIARLFRKDPFSWSTKDVELWVARRMRMAHLVDEISRSCVDGLVLLSLGPQDIQDGLNVIDSNEVKLLSNAIETLRKRSPEWQAMVRFGEPVGSWSN